MPDLPLCIAFFLPQYHPIPENDRWWGPGFTEWRNVAAARPRFRGHEQPRVPGELGYYDLRVPEVREAQASLARAAGLAGFSYYHYWFHGQRLLERPVEDMLTSGQPDLPFCLTWANENWTRSWDGGSHEILMQQRNDADDDLRHIRSLRRAFTDPRYLCVDGKPVFLVYRSRQLPDAERTTGIWREEVARWGLPGLYLLRVESFDDEKGPPERYGFDAAVQFQPSWRALPHATTGNRLRRRLLGAVDRHSHAVYRYDDVAAAAMRAPAAPYLRWPGVTPGFDNSARRRRAATIITGSTPETYARWLADAVRFSQHEARAYGHQGAGLLFVNAWNEWAEGNYLEPDLRHGRGYLDATARVLLSASHEVERAPSATGHAFEGVTR